MKKTTILILLTLIIPLASAVTLSNVDSETFYPGSTSSINIEIKNTLSQDVEDVSIALDLTNLPFIAIGGSEDSVDEIRENKEEDFTFRLQASNDIKPGDYQIPYTISYDDPVKQKKGTFGIRVSAKTELSYAVETEMPVENQQGKLSLKIINSGFSDIKFLSVKVFPSGYTLLSADEIYIGTVNSDDFETAAFDVIFKKNTRLIAQVTYKDFDNKEIIEPIEFPVTIYSKEKALELGIIKNSNAPLYIATIITLILLWILYRTIRKSRKRKAALAARS